MVWGWRSGACEGLGLEQIWKPLRERERERWCLVFVMSCGRWKFLDERRE